MSDSWSELHGEDGGYTVREWFAEAARVAERNKGRVFCRPCDDFIRQDEMIKTTRDDETIDLVCPGCGAVLVEDV